MPYNPDLDAGSLKTLLMFLTQRNPATDEPLSLSLPAPTAKESKNLAMTFRFRLYSTAKKLATSPQSSPVEREAAQNFRTHWKVTVVEPTHNSRTYSIAIHSRPDDPINRHADRLIQQLQKQLNASQPPNQPSDPATDQFVLNALGVNPDNGLGQYSTNQPEPDETAPSPDDIPANPYTQARRDQGNADNSNS